VWTYTEEHLNLVDDIIRPSHKYRIPLEYTKFERVKNKENKSSNKVTDINEA